jgi:DNA-binding MarR family transcriptional regulator
VLWELYRAEGRQLRQFEIGERVLLAKYNLSRLLDRLEAEGLVVRQPCEEDRRGANVVLTEAGKALLRQM